MTDPSKNPLFSAAVFKLSMLRSGMTGEAGFRVVYAGTLRELGVTDSEVDAYIAAHREELEAHIESRKHGA
jgi:hypothetical protein